MTGCDYCRYSHRQGWLPVFLAEGPRCSHCRHTGRQSWPLVWLAERPRSSFCRCVGEWSLPLVPIAKRFSVTVAIVLMGSSVAAPPPPPHGTEVALERFWFWLSCPLGVLAELPTGCGRALMGECWCQLSLPTRCGRLGAALESVCWGRSTRKC